MPNDEDPLHVIDEFTPIRETMLGIVAMFVADGFTDAQAREMAVEMFKRGLWSAQDDDE